MRNLWQRFKLRLAVLADDEAKRIRMQFIVTFGILSVVAFVMTVLNIITAKWMLMSATALFGVLCVVGVVLARRSERGLRIASGMLQVAVVLLYTFFIVSGSPEGFSAIWLTLLPSLGLLVFRTKRGSILCAIMFAVMLFFFRTKAGAALLQYEYTESFRLRFPFLFAAVYVLQLFLETLRAVTFDNYRHALTHDALTGALNRRGFKELVDTHPLGSGACGMGIFDLDRFKNVNDTYGHFTGDAVLTETVRRIEKLTGLAVCRWGGEEFAVFIPDGRADAQWAETIVRGFAATPFRVGDLVYTQTISLGAVTVQNGTGATPDALGRAADKCLYEAKAAGRDCAVFRSFAMAEELQTPATEQ
ncbi:MAG: GGDEF domain-containing protein [Clostridia bacterium]|nr:GGDEF domain-containing protein [Clostridia bacterium]